MKRSILYIKAIKNKNNSRLKLSKLKAMTTFIFSRKVKYKKKFCFNKIVYNNKSLIKKILLTIVYCVLLLSWKGEKTFSWFEFQISQINSGS